MFMTQAVAVGTLQAEPDYRTLYGEHFKPGMVERDAENVFILAIPVPAAVVEDGKRYAALDDSRRGVAERLTKAIKAADDDVGLSLVRRGDVDDRVFLLIEATNSAAKTLAPQAKYILSAEAESISRGLKMPAPKAL
jgi:hypothetical protein